MKRKLTYPELSPAMQREALAKISRHADSVARMWGEIYTESSLTLAQRAIYTMLTRQGRYTGVWDFTFQTPPKVMPGTEHRLTYAKKSPALA